MNNERINTIMILARALREKAREDGSNIDEAYIWFNEQCKAYSLTSREEFQVVLLAGRPQAIYNLPRIVPNYPWEPVVFADEAHHAVTKHFSKVPAPRAPRPPKAQGASVGPSADEDSAWEDSEAKQVHDVLKALWSVQ